MDYATAYHVIMRQIQTEQPQGSGTGDRPDEPPFLVRLSQGKPPVPGQITTLLLALKVIYEGLKGASMLERDLALALYRLAQESKRSFQSGVTRGVDWPPFLDQDLQRLAQVVDNIFADRWV